MLAVGELSRHRGAEDELRRPDLDGVAEAPDRRPVLEVRGDPIPHRLRARFEEEAHHLFDLGRGEGRDVRVFELFPRFGELVGHGDAGRVVQRVVERADGHVRHAHVVDPGGALPADDVGEIRHRAGAQRLMAGVARFAADDGVLQVDEAEEEQLVAKARAHAFVGGQAEEEPVGPACIAAHRGHQMLVQLLLVRPLRRDGLLLLIPHRGAVGRGRHLHTLHGRVAAGIPSQELIPDVEAGRDVPHALEEGKEPVLLGHEGRQVHGRAQSEDRVVVVDEGDVAVADIDVTGHLDEGRFGRRHHPEGVRYGATVPLDHPIEEIRGARLVACEDGIGEQGIGRVLTHLMSGQCHGLSPRRVQPGGTRPGARRPEGNPAPGAGPASSGWSFAGPGLCCRLHSASSLSSTRRTP